VSDVLYADEALKQGKAVRAIGSVAKAEAEKAWGLVLARNDSLGLHLGVGSESGQ
jgi:hypothetical protein